MPIRGSQLGLGFPSPPLAPHPTWRPLLFSEVPWSLSSTKDHCQQLQPVYWLLCWVGARGGRLGNRNKSSKVASEGTENGKEEGNGSQEGEGDGEGAEQQRQGKAETEGRGPHHQGRNQPLKSHWALSTLVPRVPDTQPAEGPTASCDVCTHPYLPRRLSPACLLNTSPGFGVIRW